MMRQLGYAFGVALLGTVFASRAAAEIMGRGLPRAAGLARALAGGQARAVLKSSGTAAGPVSAAMHAASLAGLQGAFAVAGLVGIAAGLIVLVLLRRPQASPEPQPQRQSQAQPSRA
jgi:hypothetical protein